MKIKFFYTILFSLICFLSSYIYADIKLITPEGKNVLLKDNGTWEYITISKKMTTKTNKNNNNNEYMTIDIDDLRIDIKSLKNKKVKVSAFGQYALDELMLTKESLDMSPINVNVKQLPREQLKYIIKNCNGNEQCKITVFGIVKYDDEVIEIIADKIEW